jgi:hypothetical protein
MPHTVRQHSRRTASGGTTTVRQHSRKGGGPKADKPGGAFGRIRGLLASRRARRRPEEESWWAEAEQHPERPREQPAAEPARKPSADCRWHRHGSCDVDSCSCNCHTLGAVFGDDTRASRQQASADRAGGDVTDGSLDDYRAFWRDARPSPCGESQPAVNPQVLRELHKPQPHFGKDHHKLREMSEDMRAWRSRPEPKPGPAKPMTPQMATLLGCDTPESFKRYERGRAYREAGYDGPLDSDNRIPDPDDPANRESLSALAALRK